tara:strand:+ start:316 stop:561 length:246 start_codon:yes stop_codon:yes gene_type:complete
MTKLINFAPDIFSITIPLRPRPVLRQYCVTWPCGSTWEFDREDLDIPEFSDGEQNGVTRCYDTLKEAIADLSIIAEVKRLS